MTSEQSVLPPAGGLGGLMVLRFWGSFPVRALRGGVSGGVLAGFSREWDIYLGQVAGVPPPPGPIGDR